MRGQSSLDRKGTMVKSAKTTAFALSFPEEADSQSAFPLTCRSNGDLDEMPVRTPVATRNKRKKHPIEVDQDLVSNRFSDLLRR